MSRERAVPGARHASKAELKTAVTHFNAIEAPEDATGAPAKTRTPPEYTGAKMGARRGGKKKKLRAKRERVARRNNRKGNR